MLPFNADKEDLMGVKIRGEYMGEFRTELTHAPSDSVIETDAPLDNGGKGSKFSPTDLLAASYVSCMMTIMGLRAAKREVDIKGLAIQATKIMSTTLPRKIAALDFIITMPTNLDAETTTWLLQEAQACPVALSVHPDIKTTFTVN
jgi:uncharacterized OsmC-like protein